MKFEDERKQLMEKLSKLQGLKTLLESSEVGENLMSDDEAERAILPYGGHIMHKSMHKSEEWIMTEMLDRQA